MLTSHIGLVAPIRDNAGSLKVKSGQISRRFCVFPTPTQPSAPLCLFQTSISNTSGLTGCTEQAYESKDPGNLACSGAEGREREGFGQNLCKCVAPADYPWWRLESQRSILCQLNVSMTHFASNSDDTNYM